MYASVTYFSTIPLAMTVLNKDAKSFKSKLWMVFVASLKSLMIFSVVLAVKFDVVIWSAMLLINSSNEVFKCDKLIRENVNYCMNLPWNSAFLFHSVQFP